MPTPTFVGGKHVPRKRPGREMTASRESTPPRGAEAAAGSSGSEGFQDPQDQLARTERGILSISASPSRGPRTTLRPGAQPGALPGGGGGELPGLGSAPPPRSPPGRLGLLLTAGPDAPPPPPLTSARGRGGGHGSAGVRPAQGRRPSALPLFIGSGLRRDAGGTNGLHYPRGPAIVLRHQGATVLRTGGLPSLAPPSARFLPASARSRRCAARARARQGAGAARGPAPRGVLS